MKKPLHISSHQHFPAQLQFVRISAAESFQKKLRQLGYKDVDYALSGDDALKQLCKAVDDKKPYSLVFIDMVMPVMDGWRLSSEINNNSKINSIKLYLLIPEGQMGRDAKMKRLKWFNGYLYKPIKKKQLLNLLVANSEEPIELEAVDDDTPASTDKPKEAEPKPQASATEKKPETSEAGRDDNRCCDWKKTLGAEHTYFEYNVSDTENQRCRAAFH